MNTSRTQATLTRAIYDNEQCSDARQQYTKTKFQLSSIKKNYKKLGCKVPIVPRKKNTLTEEQENQKRIDAINKLRLKCQKAYLFFGPNEADLSDFNPRNPFDNTEDATEANKERTRKIRQTYKFIFNDKYDINNLTNRRDIAVIDNNLFTKNLGNYAVEISPNRQERIEKVETPSKKRKQEEFEQEAEEPQPKREDFNRKQKRPTHQSIEVGNPEEDTNKTEGVSNNIVSKRVWPEVDIKKLRIAIKNTGNIKITPKFSATLSMEEYDYKTLFQEKGKAAWVKSAVIDWWFIFWDAIFNESTKTRNKEYKKFNNINVLGINAIGDPYDKNSKITKNRVKELQSLTKNKDHVVFWAVSIMKKTHWVLVMLKYNVVYIFDSLNNGETTKIIRDYHEYNFGIQKDDKVKYKMVKVNQQKDDVSCGIYVCMYYWRLYYNLTSEKFINFDEWKTEDITNRNFFFDDFNMKELRAEMAKLIYYNKTADKQFTQEYVDYLLNKYLIG
jgi:Ulp1 protease family, C-terminal catalytic domain